MEEWLDVAMGKADGHIYTRNSKRLGLAWLPPYEIGISSAILGGTNQLEIRVANLWANRLNWDSLRP